MIKASSLGNYFLTIYETKDHPQLWAILSAIGLFFTNYVFSQWAFAIGFFIIFMMDTATGVYIAVRTKTFSGQTFRHKLLDKCVCYFTIIIAFSAGTKIMLDESNINLIQYLNVPVYSLFIAVELRSIALNWYRFKQWPWLKELLDLFDKSKRTQVDQNLEQNSHEHEPGNN